MSKDGSQTTCKIDLGREVQQPTRMDPRRNDIYSFGGLVAKLYDRYDVSLLIGEIFGKKALDVAEVEPNCAVYRNKGQFGEIRSLDNIATEIRFQVDGALILVVYETENSRSRYYWENSSNDGETRARQVITITARDDLIAGMVAHPEFTYVCDFLRTQPASEYKPRVQEFKVDLGRAVYQLMDGGKFGQSAAYGDVALLMGKIFDESVFRSAVAMTPQHALRSNKRMVAASAEYQGLAIRQEAPRERVIETSRFSDWNLIRGIEFLVGDRKISVRYETAFKVGEPEELPAEDAAARDIITINGPKDLVDRISAHAEIASIIDGLKARDISAVESKVRAKTIAPIPPVKAPRSEGPGFPRRGGIREGAPDGQPSFTRNGISVPARFRDDHTLHTSGFTDDVGGREGPGSMRRYYERRDDNKRHFGVPGYQDQFMRAPPRFRKPEPQPKPAANAVEGLARLTMKQARPGYDRLGRRTR